MTKILLTGMTSRQCNADASKKDASFAFLLAQALREAGHEVDQRNPTMTEDYANYDKVIVGLAPIHGMGANRSYGALAAILRTWGTDKLMLMLDDPETGKVFSGIRTMCDAPHRLTKQFFSYKLEHDLASQPEWQAWLIEGVRLLRDSTWPATIIPQHSWAEAPPRLVGAGDQVPNTIGVDPSLMIKYPHPSAWSQRRQVWVTEAPPALPWLEQQKPFITLPVERHGNAGLPRFTDDAQRLETYVSVRGVIAPPVLGGAWWTPRPYLASSAGALVLTDWRSVRNLGSSWTLTAQQADMLDPDAVSDLASEQHLTLTACLPMAESIAKDVLHV